MNYDHQYFERAYFTLHEGKRRYVSALCELVQGNNRATDVLDLGCGYGFFLQGMDERGAKTYGIDSSEEALLEAKGRTKGGLFLGSSDKLPFRDESFDAITAFDVIEHVRNYEAALREAHRVLKPSGMIYIITLNSSSLLRFLLGGSWSWYSDPTHKHVFSVHQMEKSLIDAGFADVRVNTFFNLNLAGETTEFLKVFRKLGRIVFVPRIGDSMLALGRAEK